MTWNPRATIWSSNGSASSRLAPMPVISSSGSPVPRTRTRSRTSSTWMNRWSAAAGSRGPVRSDEGADTGDVPSDDEGLDGLGALVGVDGLNVRHVSDDVVVEQDSVAAQQIPGLGDHLTGAAGVVHLGDRGDGVGQCTLVLQPAQLPADQLHGADLGEHLHQPVLHDLEGDQGLAELLALLAVGQGDLVGGDGVPERAPSDGVTGAGQHPGGVLERTGHPAAGWTRAPARW